MKIDLITFIAQVVNLFVLIWLMKKFLYAPILAVIEERQKQIDDAENKAQQSLKAALKKEKLYDEKLLAFEKERASLLEKAQDDADSLKKSLLEEVAEISEKTRIKFKENLLKEKKSVDVEMQEMILTEFKTLANRAFKELASSDLQSQIAEVFSKKLQGISVVQKRRLVEEALQKGAVLEMGIKGKIPPMLEKTLNDLLEGVHFKIKQNPALICGYALRIDEKEINWSLNAYMEDFSLKLEKILKDE